MFRQLKITTLLLSAALLLASCASRKKTVQPTQPQSFDWLTANLSIQAEGSGMTFNDLNGQLRMRHDSLVWLSVTAVMGAEVVRAKISTDSIWVVNRLEHTCMVGCLDSLSIQLGTPVNLSLIQNSLLGNNQGLAPVEKQTVSLDHLLPENMSVRIKYNSVKLDEKTNFPIRLRP